MGDIRDAFPSKYLKAADLGAARPVVTIQGVTMEQIGDERLPVLSMVGKDKGLVLNRTNANMIEEICGTFETDSWRGVKIQLYATKTDFGGKRVACIRVEAPSSTPSMNVLPATPPTTTGWPSTPGRPAPLPPMPAPLPRPEPFLPPAATVASGDALADDDIPF